MSMKQTDEIRAQIVESIRDYIRNSSLPQLQIAKIIGTTQPKISEIVTGNGKRFSMEKMMQYIVLLGGEITINIKMNNENGAKE